MKKILALLTFTGLINTSQYLHAQTTHYTGIATIFDTVTSDPCAGRNCIGSEPEDSIQYVTFLTGSNLDSIYYSVFRYPKSCALKLWFNFVGKPTQIQFLKNNADSIVFFFTFSNELLVNKGIGPCESYQVDEHGSGIARISTATAGVRVQENDTSIELFPNPTNGLLKIKAHANKVTVIDNLGRIWMTQNLDTAELNTLDVSILPSGSYTISLEDGVSRTFQRFIKY